MYVTERLAAAGIHITLYPPAVGEQTPFAAAFLSLFNYFPKQSMKIIESYKCYE
jgi:hypothetical protein